MDIIPFTLTEAVPKHRWMTSAHSRTTAPHVVPSADQSKRHSFLADILLTSALGRPTVPTLSYLADVLVTSALDGIATVPTDVTQPQHTKEYKCDQCIKSFPSFQALGGHKSVHGNSKRTEEAVPLQPKDYILVTSALPRTDAQPQNTKMYQCDQCIKRFRSFQALGGHKSVHRNNNSNKRPRDQPKNMIGNPEKRQRCLELFPAPATTTSSCSDTEDDLDLCECNICRKTFPTHQTLRGHRSCHFIVGDPRSLGLFPESSVQATSAECAPSRTGEINLELRL